MGVEIVGVGKALPSRLVDNEYWLSAERGNHGVLKVFGFDSERKELTVRKTIDLNDPVQREDYLQHWILENMGPRTRYWCADNEDAVTLGKSALEEALEDAQVSPNELRGIIVGNVTHPVQWPSLACHLQEAVGARNATDVYDVRAACAGFIYALKQGRELVKYAGKPVAVAGIEVLSRVLDPEDSNGPLFGDGAGVVILKPGRKGYGILGMSSDSNPHDKAMEWLFQKNGKLYMPNGNAVMRFGINGMKDSMRKAMRNAHVRSIDILIAHQANIRMLGKVREDFVPEDQNLITIYDYGNMSSATCPVTYYDGLKKGTIKPGNVVGITALGGGIVRGAAVVRV